jgi:DNA-directed RNA polymerase subunit RPC12/RpoP
MAQPEAPIILLPPQPRNCATCGRPLHRASKAEISAGLADPRYRDVALQAAQGRLDWEAPAELGNRPGDLTGGTWLFRCRSCGNRTLFCPTLEDDASVL